VREMYDRGLQYLAASQTENGDWTGGEQGPGCTGLALMVFLASGEDPNYGLYSNHVRKALRNIISSQNADTGIMGHSMYHHGIEVPDEAIDKAVSYYKSMTSAGGEVAYSGGMGGFGESTARSSIGALVYALARRKDMAQYKATLGYLKQRLEQPPQQPYLEYA